MSFWIEDKKVLTTESLVKFSHKAGEGEQMQFGFKAESEHKKPLKVSQKF